MAEMYAIKKDDLTDIADAIRSKTGKSDPITVHEMANEISAISGSLKLGKQTGMTATAVTFLVTIIEE